jgi:hypothetical protein
MQTLALLLLLGVVASTMFGFAPSVLAQEAPAEESTEEETVEETTEEESMEDTEDAMEDTMEATMMEEIASPLQQLKSGTDPHEIQCGDGMQLVFKASNFRPACIKDSSHDVLVQRGWVSAHEPTHEELTGMMESIPKDEVMEEETGEETDDELELEEEIEVEGDSTPTNGTEPTPQSHTIELSESMEMGAN